MNVKHLAGVLALIYFGALFLVQGTTSSASGIGSFQNATGRAGMKSTRQLTLRRLGANEPLQRLLDKSVKRTSVTPTQSGWPGFVIGSFPVPPTEQSGTAIVDSRAFLKRFGKAFGVSSSSAQLAQPSVKVDELGRSHVTWKQMHKGVPVIGRGVTVHLSPNGERVEAVGSDFASGISLRSNVPRISRRRAVSMARARFVDGDLITKPLLTVFPLDQRFSRCICPLSWIFLMEAASGHIHHVVVDARRGGILLAPRAERPLLNRKIYDANLSFTNLTLKRFEGQPPIGDSQVDAAYNIAGEIYTYFQSKFGRDSWNGSGADMIVAVRGPLVGNAFWLLNKAYMGQNAFADDIIAHEFGHGVTLDEIGYGAVYPPLAQPGAVGESLSDFWGAMVDSEDWTIGEDSNDGAHRDMSNPGAFGQPDHLSEYVRTCSDLGGVHINNGIPNKAFYNVAFSLGRLKTEQIVYSALVNYLPNNVTFEGLRAAMVKSATDLYGATSAEKAAVESGFNAVGLDGVAQPPTKNCFGEIVGGACVTREALRNTGVSADVTKTTLNTLRLLRDQVMANTRAGRHYIRLYYRHSPRIGYLLFRKPSLLGTATHLLRDYTPKAGAFLRGKGDSLRITGHMRERIGRFLGDLARADAHLGGGALARTIRGQREALGGLSNYVGMTFNRAVEVGIRRLEHDNGR